MCRRIQKGLSQIPPGGDISFPSDKSFAQPTPRQHHHHQPPPPSAERSLQAKTRAGAHFVQDGAPVPKDSDSRPPTLPIQPPPAPEAKPSAATPRPPLAPLHLPNKSTDQASAIRSRCSRVPGRISSAHPAWGRGFGEGGGASFADSFLSLYLFPPSHPPTSTP